MVVRNERGAVLLLISVLTVCIATFVAIAIDSYRLTSAHTEKLVTADYAALGGLEEYLLQSYVHGQTPRLSFQVAVARAEHIAGLNKLTSRFGEAHMNPQNGDYLFQGASTSAPTDASGSIQSGIWWFSPLPKGQTCNIPSCPCSPEPPCLQICDNEDGCTSPDGSSIGLPANAMLVTLQSKQGSEVRNMFAGVFGNPQSSVNAGGIGASQTGASLASASPRRIVLLADMSRYMTIDSPQYLPYDRADTSVPADRIREYSFPLSGNCANPNSMANSQLQGTWNALSAAVKATYSCHTFDGVSYRIANSAADPNLEPQPLTNMLQGIRTAAGRFADLATPVDKLGIIGYDSTTIPSRILGSYNPSTGDYTMMHRFDPRIAGGGGTFLNQLATRSGRIETGFFPLNTGESDLAEGIRRAREMIKSDPSYLTSENIIIAFTNGMATCERATNGGMQRCANREDPLSYQYSVHQAALQETLYDVAQNLLMPEKIKLAGFIYGQETIPHTVLIKRPTGTGSGCMNDYELRSRNYLNVLGESAATNETRFSAMANGLAPTPKNYTLPAEYLYASIRLLQGFWAPVRPPCGLPPTQTTWSEEFDVRCKAEMGSKTGDPPLSLADPFETFNYVLTETAWPSGVMDLGGRRVVCDPGNVAYPSGRTMVEQVDQQIEEMLGSRSLLLVDN